MVNYIHQNSPPEQNHPPKGEPFSGNPAIYRPTHAGLLLIKADEIPKRIYLTTGTLPGDLEEIGMVTEFFSGDPYTYAPSSTNSLLIKTDGNQPSFWLSTGTNSGDVTLISGGVLAFEGSPWGIVQSDFLYQLCIDTQNKMLYYANASGSSTWQALDGLGGGSGSSGT